MHLTLRPWLHSRSHLFKRVILACLPTKAHSTSWNGWHKDFQYEVQPMLSLEQPQPQSIKKSLRKAKWTLKSITRWFLWVRKFQGTTKYSNGGSFSATPNLRWSSRSKRWYKRSRVTLRNWCQTTLLLCTRTTITQPSTPTLTKTLPLSPR